jgi:hypothetical protein
MAANIQRKVVPLGLVTALFETGSIDPKTWQMIVRFFTLDALRQA